MENTEQYTTLILAGIILHFCTYTHCTNLTDSDLQKTRFANYNPNVMPHENKTTPVKVTLDMHLMSIDNIDEKGRSITMRAFLEIVWRNDVLTWDPSEYPGVATVSVKDTDKWNPDIALQDTFDTPTEQGQGGEKANVRSTGEVTIWRYKADTLACKLYITNFPLINNSVSLTFFLGPVSPPFVS